jgi:hypothetical protein
MRFEAFGFSALVPINTVAKTVEELFAKYPTFGGVADWQ